MRYRTLTRQDQDDFAHWLNEMTKDGYHVISAGAVYTVHRGGLEWWAVLGMSDEAPDMTEEPKDELADVLEAAKKIKEFCGKTDCSNCLFNTFDGYCEFTENAPDAWGLEGRDDNV